MFPFNGSQHAATSFPPVGPDELSSPTSSVLWSRYDFPLRHSLNLCLRFGFP